MFLITTTMNLLTSFKKNISTIAIAGFSVFMLTASFFSVSMPVNAQVMSDSFTQQSTIDNYNGTYCSTGAANFDKLSDIFRYFTCFVQRALLPLFFAIAGLMFIWGTIKFMMSHDSSEREQGQQFMLWGIIGFAVMLSLWGIIRLFGDTFHINNVLPTIPTTPPQIQ